MDTGLDFLRTQIDNAVMQHDALLRSVTDHESLTDDQRFRDLCARHLPRLREQQRILEEYQAQLASGAPAGTARETSPGNVVESVAGVVKKAAGEAFGIARSLADAPPQDDFLRLAGDIVLGRQAEDIFKTFREAGRTLSIVQLARLGEVGEAGMDGYVKDANRLIQQLFVERARGAEHTIQAGTTPRMDLGY